MLGLGTELIRMAHDFREGKHVHMEPIDKDMSVQSMGVFLAPDSDSTIICCSEYPCVDELLKS
jgi:hypothetical protein